LRVLEAPAERELAWIRAHGQPRFPYNRQNREAFQYLKQHPNDHAKSLSLYLGIAPYLLPEDPHVHAPIVRLHDISPNNILVDKDFNITALIDWQHSIVLPLFLAAGIPDSFQNWADKESFMFSTVQSPKPQLPAALGSMTEEDQAVEQELYRRRHIHHYYLHLTSNLNPNHWYAITRKDEMLRRRAFDRVSGPWDGLNTPLQYDLVQVQQDWPRLVTAEPDGTLPPCPLSFSEDEAKHIDRLDSLHRKADAEVMELNERLGIGIDGWMPHEHFEESTKRARQLWEAVRAELRNNIEEDGDEYLWMRGMTEEHWPWQDFNESE
jgi:hypothetical protein